MGFIEDIKSKKKNKEAEIWFEMGMNSKDNNKKIEYFSHFLDIKPNNVTAWIKKGKALEEMGRISEAQKCYKKVNELDPVWQISTKKPFNKKETDEKLNSRNNEPVQENYYQNYNIDKENKIKSQYNNYIKEETESDEKLNNRNSEPVQENYYQNYNIDKENKIKDHYNNYTKEEKEKSIIIENVNCENPYKNRDAFNFDSNIGEESLFRKLENKSPAIVIEKEQNNDLSVYSTKKDNFEENITFVEQPTFTFKYNSDNNAELKSNLEKNNDKFNEDEIDHNQTKPNIYMRILDIFRYILIVLIIILILYSIYNYSIVN